MAETEIDLVEMLGEVRREIDKRREVYGRQVERRAMNPRTAARRIEVMSAVHRVLLDLQADDRLLPHVLRERALPLLAHRA